MFLHQLLFYVFILKLRDFYRHTALDCGFVCKNTGNGHLDCEVNIKIGLSVFGNTADEILDHFAVGTAVTACVLTLVGGCYGDIDF